MHRRDKISTSQPYSNSRFQFFIELFFAHPWKLGPLGHYRSSARCRLVSTICLLSSALWPVLYFSDFRIPTSEFLNLSSVLRPSSSVLRPLSSDT